MPHKKHSHLQYLVFRPRPFSTSTSLFLLAAGIVGASAAASTSISVDSNPHVWQPKTRSVSIFKNGMGFFVRDAEVMLRDGWCLAGEIPPAKFGTLAVYSREDSSIVDTVGAGPGELIVFDGYDTPDTIDARHERLSSLVGVDVSVTHTSKRGERSTEGRILHLEDQFVMLDTNANTIAVPVGSVSSVQVLDLPLRVHVSSPDQQQSQRINLGMAYLRDGITWIPEYSLKVLDETTAELTLRGTVVNEAEDLVHTDVNLIVGVPHFEHSTYLAPIAAGQLIRTIGGSVAPKDFASQIVNNGIVAYDERAKRGGRSTPDTAGTPMPEIPATYDGSAGDYAVYNISDVTIRRGEKAIVTLFRGQISFKDIYTWTPPGSIEHLLELTNTTDTPWTTGPIVILEGGRPLGETLLRYTPIGAPNKLPVTTAVNIKSSHEEAEVDRVLKAHEPSQNRFLDRVTIEGNMALENFGMRAAEIRVEANLPGNPVFASDGGDARMDTTNLVLSNRSGTVTWNLVIQPGESKEVTYRYERFVSSG